ncbi:protein phosphatase 2C domain-containing protein [Longispora albida]|uniref:protein phosphatase 2C domain-containing protein n=1 Tax=Longispora albida TaxID=203523 RepID=UPI0003611D15|nr:protein phosphatase 2C domain-containing protein [Longispora albida]
MTPTEPGDVLLAFWTEKREGRGEDAQPVAAAGPNGGVIAVCDGMGGAGSARVQVGDGEVSQARLAARLAAQIIAARSWGPIEDGTPEGLGDQLRSGFQQRAAELDLGSGRLRSRMLRTLPTTLALGHYEHDEDRVRLQALWAGDSRVYVLAPATGLQQVTEDDLRSRGDAMANLSEDSPLSNMVSASAAFTVNSRWVEVPAGPCVLLAATDGCFGYVRTPLHFESLLLRAMAEAKSYEEWCEAVKSAVLDITGDDASMAIAVPGSPPWEEFRAAFGTRAREVAERVGLYDREYEELLAARAHLSAQEGRVGQIRMDLWDEYKETYEFWIRETEAGSPPAPVKPAAAVESTEIPVDESPTRMLPVSPAAAGMCEHCGRPVAKAVEA